MNILILCHEQLVPDIRYQAMSDAKIENQSWRTEGFVAKGLRKLGHKCAFCGISDKISPLRKAIFRLKPDVIFNLLEEFDDEGLFEPIIVNFLEGEGYSITGCGGNGLLFARNKVATKILLGELGVRVPSSHRWPQIVKFVAEESSRGLSTRSIVNDNKQLKREIARLKKKASGRVFSEEYVEGRELYCGVFKHQDRIVISDLWETSFGNMRGPKILTERAKWDFAFRRRHGVKMARAKNINQEVIAEARNFAELATKALEIRGAARIDFRLSPKKGLYVIEINPNPDLATYDEYAVCLVEAGIKYSDLMQMIVDEALSRGTSRPGKGLNC